MSTKNEANPDGVRACNMYNFIIRIVNFIDVNAVQITF